MTKLVSLPAAAMFVAMVATPVTAQWVVQPAIGVNFAKITNGDQALSDPSQGITAESKTRTGFAAGVGILYAVSPQFTIGTGGYYSQQGIKGTLSDGTVQVDGTFEIDYVQVPDSTKTGIVNFTRIPSTYYTAIDFTTTDEQEFFG